MRNIHTKSTTVLAKSIRSHKMCPPEEQETSKRNKFFVEYKLSPIQLIWLHLVCGKMFSLAKHLFCYREIRFKNIIKNRMRNLHVFIKKEDRIRRSSLSVTSGGMEEVTYIRYVPLFLSISPLTIKA